MNNNDFKYVFNTKTKTLHKVDGCIHSKKGATVFNCKFYKEEDDVIKENKKYYKYCQLCFKRR